MQSTLKHFHENTKNINFQFHHLKLVNKGILHFLNATGMELKGGGGT